jgi:hypothetical protein
MLAGIAIGVGIIRDGGGASSPTDQTVSKFIPSGSSGFITSDSRVFKVRAEE